MSQPSIEVITPKDSDYPPLLKQIPRYPKQLYIRGDIKLLQHPHLLAVVGSRRANAYGKQSMNLLLPPVVEAGAVLVSGLAYGIDSLAHQICVEAGRPTIAVLGGGIDDKTIYPVANRKLAAKILKTGGAIISEYEPGTPARPGQFPARNRIVAALCQATLVVQAATKSGSLITARLALETNRDVIAVPGQITDIYSQGTNALIQDGAIPALTPQDIADVMKINLESAKKEAYKNLPEPQQTILQHVSSEPRHVDEISGLVKLPAEQVSTLLLELELSDHIMHVGGMKYVKK